MVKSFQPPPLSQRVPNSQGGWKKISTASAVRGVPKEKQPPLDPPPLGPVHSPAATVPRFPAPTGGERESTTARNRGRRTAHLCHEALAKWYSPPRGERATEGGAGGEKERTRRADPLRLVTNVTIHFGSGAELFPAPRRKDWERC